MVVVCIDCIADLQRGVTVLWLLGLYISRCCETLDSIDRKDMMP